MQSKCFLNCVGMLPRWHQWLGYIISHLGPIQCGKQCDMCDWFQLVAPGGNAILWQAIEHIKIMHMPCSLCMRSCENAFHSNFHWDGHKISKWYDSNLLWHVQNYDIISLSHLNFEHFFQNMDTYLLVSFHKLYKDLMWQSPTTLLEPIYLNGNIVI